MKIVITGTSSGIGRALAERLLSRGDEVWGLARSAHRLEPAARYRSSRCDVAAWPEVERVTDEIAETWQRIDALVTCAGVQGAVGPAVRSDPRRWSETVRANLDGTFHAIRAFHPLLSPVSGRPKIVCFSGGGATKARPQFSAYGVAKTAVVRLVETIAAEEPALDINAVAPGAIPTRLTDEVIALGEAVVGREEYEAAVKLKAAGGAPLEQALRLVEWLLSPASDGISGRLISAPWDPWRGLAAHRAALAGSDVFMLRRVLPKERGLNLPD